MNKNLFYEKCYKVLCRVPKGKVTTYKSIAYALNSKAYRAVGTAMNKNPYAPSVPCHRVVNSDGSVGKFACGTSKKIKMLRTEGIVIGDGEINLGEFEFKF